VFFALSAPLAATNSGGGFNYSLLVFALLIGGMFWFMSRAQRRQRQRMAALQSQLVPGQEVMTSAGIYGRVVDATDDRVRVEVAPGVVLTLAKQAVSRTVDPPAATGPGTSTETGDTRETTTVD
jgi:preprotein translocase subunit YajC